MDGGTASYSLPVYRYRKLIIIDSVGSSHHPPGTILKFGKADILNGKIKGTSHDIDLYDYIAALEFRGEAPDEILLIGVVPENLDAMSMGLSDSVKSAISEVIKIIQETLATWSG